LVIKALDPDRIRIGIHPKMLDPDEMNADPQPWFLACSSDLDALKIGHTGHFQKKQKILTKMYKNKSNFRIGHFHTFFIYCWRK
jgi:hypothetical protein